MDRALRARSGGARSLFDHAQGPELAAGAPPTRYAFGGLLHDLSRDVSSSARDAAERSDGLSIHTNWASYRMDSSRPRRMAGCSRFIERKPPSDRPQVPDNFMGIFPASQSSNRS